MLPCKDHGKAGNAHGYASCWYEGQLTSHHRAAYCKANNVTLAAIYGLVIRHTCDNKRCEEPSHLIKGTQADNIRDTIGKKVNNGVVGVLTDQQVAEVRQLFILGATRKELALRFSASYQAIKQIIAGRRR